MNTNRHSFAVPGEVIKTSVSHTLREYLQDTLIILLAFYLNGVVGVGRRCFRVFLCSICSDSPGIHRSLGVS